MGREGVGEEVERRTTLKGSVIETGRQVDTRDTRRTKRGRWILISITQCRGVEALVSTIEQHQPHHLETRTTPPQPHSHPQELVGRVASWTLLGETEASWTTEEVLWVGRQIQFIVTEVEGETVDTRR